MRQLGGETPTTTEPLRSEWRMCIVSDGRVRKNSLFDNNRGTHSVFDECRVDSCRSYPESPTTVASSAHVGELQDALASLGAARGCLIVASEELALLKVRVLNVFMAHAPYLTTEESANFFLEFAHKTRPDGPWAFVREERGCWRPLRFGNTRTYQACARALKDIIITNMGSLQCLAHEGSADAVLRALRHKTWRTLSKPAQWINELSQAMREIEQVSEAINFNGITRCRFPRAVWRNLRGKKVS